MMVSNNAGSNTTYNYEDFHTTRTGLTNECLFDLFGTICPGGSLKLVPKYYKGATQNMDESLTGCKFPICNWNSDVYINWLTQNSANLAYSKIEAGINIASGIVEGLTGNVASGINKAYSSGKSLGNQMLQQKLHELIPPTAQGNVNAGDVMQGIDSKNSTSTSHKPKNTYSIYDMSIKREYAQKIDDYFTKYGYKVNKVKIPEFTSRTYWNYVEIAQGESIGYGEIPADAMETINNIFRNGVTIWHHHNQLGDFSLHNWL